MSPALMEAPAALFADNRRRTLEHLLEAKWHAARADGETDCPVCSATMHLDGQAAHCTRCGTALS
jgi:uncharacterized paraquat-inducible protein A